MTDIEIKTTVELPEGIDPKDISIVPEVEVVGFVQETPDEEPVDAASI